VRTSPLTEEETREAAMDALDSLPPEIAARLDNVAEVRRTILYEVGHYFGMDERQVRSWGL
jgi:predicted Zn-dependent protease with MMP-like domain